MKKRLGLVYGGQSAEHEVSLSTACAVTQAIDFNKYEVYPVFITKAGEWRVGEQLTAAKASAEEMCIHNAQEKPHSVMAFLQLHEEQPFDIVFPLLHGTNGEDGTVQGFLEVLNIPYVGNNVLGSSTGMDKVVMKQLFDFAGLPQVPYTSFIRSDWQQDADAVIAKSEQIIHYPMYVKPANLGSSVGITKAENKEELHAAIELALKYDRKIVIERGIDAREIELAVLGNDNPQVSVAGEIKALTDFYDYESKYQDGSTQLIIPAQLDEAVFATLQNMAKKAFKAIDGSGLVRADFFVTADNKIFINEVNTMPGFTPVSMYPLLWQKTGVAYGELIDRLIDLGVERFAEKQRLQYNM